MEYSKKYRMSFDLISDLYIDNWDHDIQWDGLGTSLISIVAGNVSSDVDHVIWELKRISKAYKQTFYIEGDLEHSATGWPSADVHTYLKSKISNIPNCIYLHDNVVIFDNQAFVGANLWRFPIIQTDQNWDDFALRLRGHKIDLEYLKSSVSRMQRAHDVDELCVISHTAPNFELLSEYEDAIDTTCNASEAILQYDTNNKIKTWCFGHSPQSIDYTIADVRYVSNPRGIQVNKDDKAYYPLRIEI